MDSLIYFFRRYIYHYIIYYVGDIVKYAICVDVNCIKVC